MWNVRIHHRLPHKNCRNCCANEISNHSFYSRLHLWFRNFLVYSPCDHILCKFSNHTAFRSVRIVPPSFWVSPAFVAHWRVYASWNGWASEDCIWHHRWVCACQSSGWVSERTNILQHKIHCTDWMGFCLLLRQILFVCSVAWFSSSAQRMDVIWQASRRCIPRFGQLFSTANVYCDVIFHIARCGRCAIYDDERIVSVQVSGHRMFHDKPLLIFVSSSSSCRSRGFATGIAAAANYCMQFVATKTYYNLEMGLSLPGVASFYAVIAVMG